MAFLKETVQLLTTQIADLEQRRQSDTLTNDIYEAACYWRDLGNWVLENNTKVNFPLRAHEELASIADFKNLLINKRPEQQAKFASVLQTGEKILKQVETVHPLKDGHLGVLRAIHKSFAFLRTDYHFSIADEQPIGVKFSSGEVWLQLEYAKDHTSSCSFGPASNPSQLFWVDDLLFMNKDPRYRTLPTDLHLEEEGAVENWFAFLGGVFEQYGNPVLTNQSGIFVRLAKAQAERDAEYVREMDQKFGADRAAGGAPDQNRAKNE